MKTKQLTTLMIALLFSLASVISFAAEPLKLGIMPFNSALALIKTHQPLRLYLEEKLGEPVEIYTSADYYTFINELIEGKYDIAIAGPHFARIAAERHWVPLVRYKIDLQPVFVVAKNSPINNAHELKNKRIGLSSRLSISSIGGVKWLEDQGLKLGKDFQISERTTHGAAVAAVVVGELDAALTTYTPLKQIPDDIQSKIKVLPLDVKVPHLMTLANRKLGSKKITAIKNALLSFENSDLGQQFFSATGYEGYKEISAKDTASLKPYVNLTIQMMKNAQ